MELKILIKNTYHLASAKLVRLVIGLVRAKLNALFLGTTGLGIVSQILFINGRFNDAALLGMNDGLVKQLASRKEDPEYRTLMLNSIKSYFVVISITTLLVVGLALVFSHSLTMYFFGDEASYPYFLICVVCVPISILNSVSFALLKTFKLINKIARAELIGAIASFFLFVPAVYFFQLQGAVVVVVLNLLVILLLNYLFTRKYVLKTNAITIGKVFTRGKIVSADIKELTVFGGYGLSLGLYMMLIVVVKRSLLVSHLGIEGIGLYAPNIAWAGLYTGMILPSVRHYLYPRFAELKSDKELVAVINDAFRLATFFMIPLLFGGIILRRLLIPLFYSAEFVNAAEYLPGHFLGALFFVWSQILIMVFTPTGRIRIYAIFQFILQSLALGLAFYLIPKFGLYGYMMSFVIEPSLFILTSYVYLRKAIGLSFARSNLAVMLFIVLSSAALFALSEWNIMASYGVGALITIIVWFFLREGEKAQVINKLKSLKRFGRKNK